MGTLLHWASKYVYKKGYVEVVKLLKAAGGKL